MYVFFGLWNTVLTYINLKGFLFFWITWRLESVMKLILVNFKLVFWKVYQLLVADCTSNNFDNHCLFKLSSYSFKFPLRYWWFSPYLTFYNSVNSVIRDAFCSIYILYRDTSDRAMPELSLPRGNYESCIKCFQLQIVCELSALCSLFLTCWVIFPLFPKYL